MSGWGAKRLAEERELKMRRIPPTAGAITRFEEVLDWTATRIHDELFRQLVWAFAHCRSNQWSFSAKCKKEGWNRVTAYERLERTFRRIAIELDNESVVLRMPDEKWALQEQAIPGSNSDMMAALASDLLKTEADVRRFAKHLKAVNRVRRKEQERRKRAFLGEEGRTG
jgi:hypothetical protein